MQVVLQTLVQGQRESQQVATALVALTQQFLRMQDPGGPLGPQTAHDVARSHLTKLTADDDVEAYLYTFEQTAARERWPRANWADILAPYLTGEAQRAYQALPWPNARNYDTLKQEILLRLGFSPVAAAKQYQSWSYSPDRPVRIQMTNLIRTTQRWLQPD